MSFNLPRNQKDLRFTGELRAAVDEHPRGKLGMPRPRRTPQPGQSAFAPDVYHAEPIPTPFSPPPIASLSLEDDDSPTTMLDRDGLDVLPGGFAQKPAHQERGRKTTPVPNFRMPAGMPKVIVTPEPKTGAGAQAKTPPLLFWLVAAIILGVASYRIAPRAIAHGGHHASRTTNSR